jgi:hypothetical protein
MVLGIAGLVVVRADYHARQAMMTNNDVLHRRYR